MTRLQQSAPPPPPPPPGQPARAQAARQAATEGRIGAELARARAAVANAERQAGVAPSLVMQPPGQEGTMSITTSPDGRTTTINENGKLTRITTDENGQVTIKSGEASTTVPQGPGADAIRQLAEQQARATVQAMQAVAAMPPMPPNQDQIPDGVVPLAGIVLGMIACTIIGLPLARASARRMDRKSAPTSPDLTLRLDRIEQAVESMSVEMERVSEAQRYSARLLTERLPEAPTRVIQGAEQAR